MQFKIVCFNLGFKVHSIDVFQTLIGGIPISSTLNFKIIYTSKRIDFLKNMRDLNRFPSSLLHASNTFFPLRNSFFNKILVGKNKSVKLAVSKLSFLPRVLSRGDAEAAVSAGLAVGKVGQGVWSDQVSEKRTQAK